MAQKLSVYVRPLRRRDGDDCAICHDLIDFALKVPDPMAPSVDHLVPRSLGGKTTLSNLRLAHRDCNGRRGNGTSTRRRKRADAHWDDWSAARP